MEIVAGIIFSKNFLNPQQKPFLHTPKKEEKRQTSEWVILLVTLIYYRRVTELLQKIH